MNSRTARARQQLTADRSAHERARQAESAAERERESHLTADISAHERARQAESAAERERRLTANRASHRRAREAENSRSSFLGPGFGRTSGTVATAARNIEWLKAAFNYDLPRDYGSIKPSFHKSEE